MPGRSITLGVSWGIQLSNSTIGTTATTSTVVSSTSVAFTSTAASTQTTAKLAVHAAESASVDNTIFPGSRPMSMSQMMQVVSTKAVTIQRLSVLFQEKEVRRGTMSLLGLA
jgi:hypothetical protein